MNEAPHPGNADLPIGNAAPHQHQHPHKTAEEAIGGGIDREGRDERQIADQEIGVPGGPEGPGWHGRAYLPHFDSSQVTQHVTFHLADSLARATLERMEEELRKLPVTRRDVERRKKIEAWIDAGHGSCLLGDPVIAAMVQNALLFFDDKRYYLLAWVIMPNHVHVFFRTIPGWTVAKVVASWKKFTARQIRDHQRNFKNANLPIGATSDIAKTTTDGKRPNANQEIGVPEDNEPIWHREYWDRFMRDESHFLQAVDYIHQNPVKAGLVASAEDWRWSSAHPGNANLPIGSRRKADQEFGVPGITGETT